ncbi:MAG: type II toxin-antitoxin system HicB family antitoxin [Acinetobacter sp.]|nr:type II toxin-antitoxin system HicB family antitoxin [Acinetobacter sp.]
MLYPIAIDIPCNEREGYSVRVPDFALAFQAGKSLDEAVAYAKDMMMSYVEQLMMQGESIPLATMMERYQYQAEYFGVAWTLVELDLRCIKCA